jgi:hypothetical protein
MFFIGLSPWVVSGDLPDADEDSSETAFLSAGNEVHAAVMKCIDATRTETTSR